MWNDLVYGLRLLRKSPGFTAVAVLTLGVGIAVNTNIFGMISAFFLQPMPVRDADRLVLLLQRSDMWSLPHGHSFPDFKDFRDRMGSLTDWIAYLPTPAHLSASGQTPERTWVELVTPSAFALLDIRAEIGRTLLPEDGEGLGGAPVALLSHDYWQRRFGGDPSVVGRTIGINGKPFRVVGVARKGFHSLSWAMAMSAFVPSGVAPDLMQGEREALENREVAMWRVMARLKPGVKFGTARTEAQMVGAQLAKEYPAAHKNGKALLMRETSARPDPTFADFMPVCAAVFTGMVSLVLFIACANVANLMLARAVGRQREMVVRAAVGASRWRLVRQVLTEAVVLGVIAGAVGFMLAEWAGRALQGFTPSGDIPVNTDHPTTWRVYVFTGLVSVLAGLLAGLGPALHASDFNLVERLKAGGGGRVAGGKHRFRNLLVVGQVTLSLVVLICGGLFLHSLNQVKNVPLGFRPEKLLLLSFDLGIQGYADERGRTFHRELLERVRALPGVTAASLTQHVPFGYGIQMAEVGPDEPPSQFRNGVTSVCLSRVEHTYLPTMGTPLLRGRDFTVDDGPLTKRVAIVNEAMAKLCWPGREVLGRRFRLGREGEWVEVVGVVATGKHVMLAEQSRPYFYLPMAQNYASASTLVLRAVQNPTGLGNAVREVVRSLDPDLPVHSVLTMESHVRTSAFGLMPLRMGATLAGCQGLIGLLLAVMGLYAVVAYAVLQRTQEIGIRMALGARWLDVVRFIVRDGLRLTVVGVALGLLVALGISFVLARVLYGVSPLDLGVFGGVTLLLLATAALACYWPARRAARVDPTVALRCE